MFTFLKNREATRAVNRDFDLSKPIFKKIIKSKDFFEETVWTVNVSG